MRTSILKNTVTYFVMAFNVNTGKKEIRSEIVKDDKNKAIALANSHPNWLTHDV